MSTLLLLFHLSLNAAGVLGPPLRQDGYQVRPPVSFHMGHMEYFRGTRAGAVSASSQSSRFLSAALVDGEAEDSAAMLISVVEATLVLGTSSREALAGAVLRHFRDELSLPFELERAEVAGQSAPRVEVLGSVREGSQLRRILVAAFPSSDRHVVVMFSVPAGRWDELRAGLEESLETMRLDSPQGGTPRQWKWAFLAMMALLLALSLMQWSRGQTHRRNS